MKRERARPNQFQLTENKDYAELLNCVLYNESDGWAIYFILTFK